jgi:CDP-paratose 2-epimerase
LVNNAGGGLANAISLREMTGLCEEIAGKRIEIGASPEDRPADVRIYITDHRRLTDFCGWRPRRDVAAALADIRRWIRDEEPLLRGVLNAW